MLSRCYQVPLFLSLTCFSALGCGMMLAVCSPNLRAVVMREEAGALHKLVSKF